MRSAVGAALLLVVVGACAEEPLEVRTVTLKPYQVPCTSWFLTSCMTGTDDDGNGVTFYDGIDGFEFQWGATRRVTYATYEVDEPAADASSIRYELQSEDLIVVADPAEEFTLEFAPSYDSWFLPASAPNRRSFAGAEIACEPALCTELDARTTGFTLRLKYDAPAGAVATALAIE